MSVGARRSVVLLALAVAGLLGAPGAAAGLSFSPCSFEPNAGCARVTVPLDRSGSVAGMISLQVERFGTAGPGHDGVLLAIAGGPGQSATAVFGEPYLTALGPVLSSHDFVTLDLRGTGRSGALRCPSLENAAPPRLTSAAAACAASLGPRRAFYTTLDSVADIEAVRVALGVPRLTLYGISYGSKVALAYATRYPDHVERMVLDSVVGADGPDTLYRDSLAALPRVLRAICRGGGCRHITRDPYGDLAAVAARLLRAPLRGSVFDGRGRRRRAALRADELFGLLLDGDLAPTVRAAIPAAMRSARRGDGAPLLRLAGAGGSPAARAAAFLAESRALFAATTCEEATLPWARTAALDDRPAQARAFVTGLPAAAFAPFDGATILATEDVKTCLRWPQTESGPPSLGVPPSVPALLLEGESDLRTPVEGAHRLAATLPASTVVVSPSTGHGVLPNPPACIGRALRQFFAGAAVTASCAFGPPRAELRPLPLAPTSLGAVPAAAGLPGTPGRTLAAVALTFADLAAQARDPAVLFGGRVGGLRGGSLRFVQSSVSLARLQFVPGVAISGRLTGAGGALSIGGSAAAHGRLKIRRSGAVSGTLAGHAVSGRVPAALFRNLG